MPIPPPLQTLSFSAGSPGGWDDADDGPLWGWGARLRDATLSLLSTPVMREGDAPGFGTEALSAAVSAIVAIAAQRARAAGDLSRLRALIERTLDAAEPAADELGEGTGLPCIADADFGQERQRLSALAQYQAG